MISIYLLQHSYEIDSVEETKIIGIYSSRKRAEMTVEKYKLLPGFGDYPDCFFIDEYEVDTDHWAEGYIKWDDVNS